MAIRDLLLPLLSYPAPLSPAAIERVVRLAAGLSQDSATDRYDSIPTRISALVYDIEVEPGLYFEGADIGSFLAAQSSRSTKSAGELETTFKDIAARHGARHRCRRQKRTASQASRHVVEEARLHHATVLPMGQDDAIQQDLAVQLLFNTGRPVLVCPDNPARKSAGSFRTAVIAWDASRAATRAIADAMPYLRRASAVRIFTASDDKPMASGRGYELVEHLALHGVNAIFEEVRKTDAHTIGNFMEAYVAQHDADLLVMGAYGHSRLREFILGGATRSILMNPPGWVLLSH